MSGQYSQKSDVYSFGVVMLELLTGRKAFDRWARRLLRCNLSCTKMKRWVLFELNANRWLKLFQLSTKVPTIVSPVGYSAAARHWLARSDGWSSTGGALPCEITLSVRRRGRSLCPGKLPQFSCYFPLQSFVLCRWLMNLCNCNSLSQNSGRQYRRSSSHWSVLCSDQAWERGLAARGILGGSMDLVITHSRGKIAEHFLQWLMGTIENCRWCS